MLIYLNRSHDVQNEMVNAQGMAVWMGKKYISEYFLRSFFRAKCFYNRQSWNGNFPEKSMMM